MPDSRLNQARALADDARTLVSELEDEGAGQVGDQARLASAHRHLNAAIRDLKQVKL